MKSFEPISLNLPKYPFRIKQETGKFFIFDESRKKFLLLTPEEWVRQHMVQYLIHVKKYPRSLIKLEGSLKLNSLRKRSDILLYNQAGEKRMLVECKSPSVKINQKVFDQVALYNSVHQVQWLLVSNGLEHYCCKIDFATNKYCFIEEAPEYSIVG